MTTPTLYSSGGLTASLSSSPDPLSSLFSSSSSGLQGCGTDAEWDWSSNLLEFAPPSPQQLSSVPQTSNNVNHSTLSPVSPLSPINTSNQSLSPINTSSSSPSSSSQLSPIHPSQSPLDSSHSPAASVPQVNYQTPTPSPEQIHEQINPATVRKRRKREINLSPEMYNIGFEWSHYNSPSSTFQIYDTTTMQLITNQFDIVTHKVESNTHFSLADNAWICYRQNQFKIVCFLKCPQPQPAMSISDSGVLKEVHQLCVKLYAIKEMSTLVSDEVRVGMHHVGRARVKKEKQEINITPFVNGRVEFANVQFEKSNSVKGQQLEYFRLVMAFYAKAGNAYFHIFSKQSPKLIVRSQNPGFYGDTGFNYGASIGVVPSGVVPDSSILKSGRVGGITGGVGIPLTNVDVNNSNNNEMQDIHSVNNGVTNNNGNNVVYNNTNNYFQGDVKVDLSAISVGIGANVDNNGRVGGIKRTAESAGDDYSYQGVNGANYALTNTMNFVADAKETDHLLTENGSKQTNNVFYGKVGINVEEPSESLTVRGNVLIHGDLFKPSDQRIKSDIVRVDAASQLGNIRDLKLYDYTVSDRKERGVLAQELQQVMPSAVHEVGDVTLENGKVIPNMLTVNERALLYENIGATQQLDKDIATGRMHIVDINKKVEHLAVRTSQETASVKGTVSAMLTLFFQEETSQTTQNGLEEEYVNFGFSLFRMGPARTLLVLGHFFPPIWAIGALFLFSNITRRRVIAVFNALLLGFYTLLSVLEYKNPNDAKYSEYVFRSRIVWASIGLLLVLINYVRLRNKIKQEQKDKPFNAKAA